MKQKIQELITKILPSGGDLSVDIPPRAELGHYSTSVAMRLAKTEKKPPLDIAKELAKKIEETAPKGLFSKIEAAPPGFVNFWISDEAVREEFTRLAADAERGVLKPLGGKRVMVEYTDPNPFKQFHIGHLMTNMIGEAIARLYEGAGAEVLRANYQGDVGLHVAKSIWGMMQFAAKTPKADAPLADKTAFLGEAYVAGAKAYDEPAAKTEITELNRKIYDRSDAKVNELYDTGRKWSLDYFETLYARLGTKFAHYFFESEAGPDGLAIVKAHPDVFTESEGAIIFRGEAHGLHNRVFISAQGLPTYEAKELGLNKKKFDLYHPELSLIVTGNEINEYFRVLLKAMEMVVPEAAAKTKHIGHGMLRLPSGKMSSRTGDVITAESLIEDVKRAVGEKIKDRELSDVEREEIQEAVAIAAIRYSILKQSIGGDIIFDMERSIAFHGDSGPYLQYTYARMKSILAKSSGAAGDTKHLETNEELDLMRKMAGFPDAVARAVEQIAPHIMATYLYELADIANRYYESTPILKDENENRRNARLLLVATIADILKRGLGLLGIKTLEKI